MQITQLGFYMGNGVSFGTYIELESPEAHPYTNVKAVTLEKADK